jgi:hypothetical protein
MSKALAKKMGLLEEGSKHEEPPEEEKGKGLLGAEQWTALLNLLSGQHPHGAAAASNDAEEDEEEDGGGNGDGDHDDGDDEGDDEDEEEEEEGKEEKGDGEDGSEDDEGEGGSSDENEEDREGEGAGSSSSSGPSIDCRLLVLTSELPFAWMAEQLKDNGGPAAAAAAAAAANGGGGGAAAIASRRVGHSVFARNWLPEHRDELATLVETLLKWRDEDEGRECLLVSGAGGGCDCGLVSSLHAKDGPLVEQLGESGLHQFVVGPTGAHAASGIMPSGFSRGPRSLGGLSGPGGDACANLVFTHEKVVQERNYGVFTFGVHFDPTAPAQDARPANEAARRKTLQQKKNQKRKSAAAAAAAVAAGGDAESAAAAAAAATAAAPDPNSLPNAPSALGRYYGWWTGDVVGHSEVRMLHPLPGQQQQGGGDGEGGSDDDDDDDDDDLNSVGGGGEGGGGGSSKKKCLSSVRAPFWFFKKFLKTSDMIFVDDDVRLRAAEDAGYMYLLSTKALRSHAFEQCARDAFSLFHLADAFTRDRRSRTASVEDGNALLLQLRRAVKAVWQSPAALDAKARKATGGLCGQDSFVLDLALVHALDGRREQFESAQRFMELVRECVRGAGLVRFAATSNDDDDRKKLGRLAAEIAALQGRKAADEAAARARKAEDARLEKLKKSHPGKYQEEMADRAVREKAEAKVREKERKEAAKEAEKALAEAAKQREKDAQDLVKAEEKAKRAKVASLNKLADEDPEAYAKAVAEDARRVEAALAAGLALGADGMPTVDANTPAGRRLKAMQLNAARGRSHANEHRELQEKRQRLRLKVGPLFNVAETK